MMRVLFGALALAPLCACTYVNERQASYPPPAYAAPAYPAPGYAAPAAPVLGGYRDGSYEAEQQAYEYGRRDGAAAQGRVWR